MKIIKAHNLACPIDNRVLLDTGKQLCCDNGHSYDISRQGYVNLLPVQHKRSKDPGDSKEMVQARTHFLNANYYKPVAKKLVEKIDSLFDYQLDNKLCLLDAGCGEGYYLNCILQELNNKPGTSVFSLVGLDISKFAISAAAKRSSDITWLVGTNRQPPLVPSSVDIIVCVFGFHSFDGFNTVLTSDGVIILVEPGPNHLKELREVIYSDVKITDPPDLSAAEKLGFSLLSSESLQYQTGEINNAVIANLLLMTPHFFKANKQGRESASNIEKINLTIDLVFRILKKA